MATFGGIVILLLGFVLIGFVYWDGESQNSYALPILMGMVAFPAMIFTILYASRVTYDLGVSSSGHAFGMPPGSIRAILAMGFIMLVLIFGVFTIHIGDSSRWELVQTFKLANHEDTNDRLLNEIKNYPSSYKLTGKSAFSPGQIIPARKANPAAGITPTSARAAETSQGGEITVYKSVDNSSAVQLAQQVLTMLATALTAIVGFYFGSRTASEPQSTIQNRPTQDLLRQAKIIRDGLDVVVKGVLDNGGIVKINEAIVEKTGVDTDDNIELGKKRTATAMSWHSRFEAFGTKVTDLTSDQQQVLAVVDLLNLTNELKSIEGDWAKILTALNIGGFTKFDEIDS